MVGVAQLVELSVVVRVVAGSSPVAHPIFWLYQPYDILCHPWLYSPPILNSRNNLYVLQVY